MRRLILLLLFALITAACAHSPQGVTPTQVQTITKGQPSAGVASPALMVAKSDPGQYTVEAFKGHGTAIQPVEFGGDEQRSNTPATQAQSQGASLKVGKNDQDGEEESEPEEIADPLEPYNRAIFQFNDKLYFWVLKPVAQGYSKVVPETARVSVSNFFTNAAFPLRFISCLLQTDFSGAGTELGRFLVNTIWGIGGLMDPASTKQLSIPGRDSDLGQTLGIYGVGQGFYIVWPFLGPSSARDSINIVGDYFLNPINNLPEPWYAWAGIRSYQAFNETSLKIGNYESLKGAAIDPYISVRNAYAQYRENKVKKSKERQTEPPRPGGLRFGELNQEITAVQSR